MRELVDAINLTKLGRERLRVKVLPLSTSPRMPCGSESVFTEIINIPSDVFFVDIDCVYRNIYIIDFVFYSALRYTLFNAFKHIKFVFSQKIRQPQRK